MGIGFPARSDAEQQPKQFDQQHHAGHEGKHRNEGKAEGGKAAQHEAPQADRLGPADKRHDEQEQQRSELENRGGVLERLMKPGDAAGHHPCRGRGGMRNRAGTPRGCQGARHADRPEYRNGQGRQNVALLAAGQLAVAGNPGVGKQRRYDETQDGEWKPRHRAAGGAEDARWQRRQERGPAAVPHGHHVCPFPIACSGAHGPPIAPQAMHRRKPGLDIGPTAAAFHHAQGRIIGKGRQECGPDRGSDLGKAVRDGVEMVPRISCKRQPYGLQPLRPGRRAA